jgi:predicted dinucleotide-binding enzyme
VIDCNNSAILGLDVPDRDHRPGLHFTTPIPSLAERLAADIKGARVVKAFNTITSKVIELEREKLAPRRVSVFLCSDDQQAKSIVSGLAEELGFVGVDSGELERAQLVEAVADFIRFQIISMGRGPFATISVNGVNI